MYVILGLLLFACCVIIFTPLHILIYVWIVLHLLYILSKSRKTKTLEDDID